MNGAEARYEEIAADLQATRDAVSGQMFGKRCLKLGGKAFVCLFEEAMVFKLTGAQHAAAIALPGAKLFDPSGRNRPMKEWVQVPFDSAAEWTSLAEQAVQYAGAAT